MATDETSASAADVWTVQRILLWTSSFLKQKGVEAARLEAELLLSHARNCARIHLYTDMNATVTDDERTRMREMVQRRAKREPLAYIVGHREFYGRRFDVGTGVLIPRPETESLVDVCLESIPKEGTSRIIEIGFGSGCIAVTIALQRQQTRITATDISPAAMDFATRNCTRHQVQDRVTLVAGSALEPFFCADGQIQDPSTLKGSAADSATSPAGETALPDSPVLWDGLVSNPPYVRDDEWADLQPEVGLHEPREALLAGTDGLDVVRLIVQNASQLLKPGAFIAMELDPDQCQTAAELFSKSGFTACRVRKDLSGNDRIVQGIRSEP